MYKIYNIVDNTNNNIYVGKTNNMKQRMILHLSDLKSETRYCSSEIVLKNNNYTLKIIEDNLTEEDAIIKEKYYIQNTENCINKRKYDFNKNEYMKEYNKQYRLKNKQVISLNNKELYKKNKQKRKDYQKQYYEKNKTKKIVNEILNEIIEKIELEY